MAIAKVGPSSSLKSPNKNQNEYSKRRGEKKWLSWFFPKISEYRAKFCKNFPFWSLLFLWFRHSSFGEVTLHGKRRAIGTTKDFRTSDKRIALPVPKPQTLFGAYLLKGARGRSLAFWWLTLPCCDDEYSTGVDLQRIFGASGRSSGPPGLCGILGGVSIPTCARLRFDSAICSCERFCR